MRLQLLRVAALALVVLASSALVDSTATAATSNKIDKVSVINDGAGWNIAEECPSAFGVELFIEGQASGSFFADNPNGDWDGTAVVSLLKAGNVLTTFSSSTHVRSYEGGKGSFDLDTYRECVAFQKMAAAGIGSKAGKYEIRVDKVTFTNEGKAVAVAGGPSRVVSIKQMIRATSRTRTKSGSSYIWKGKVERRVKDGSKSAWAPVGKGVKLFVYPDSCSRKTVQTDKNGAFVAKFGKVGEKYVVLKYNGSSTTERSGTTSYIKKGTMVNAWESIDC